MRPEHPHDSPAGRQQRLEALLEDLARQLSDGAELDIPALQRAHADLMPELGERIREIGRLRAARDRVIRERRRATPPEAAPAVAPQPGAPPGSAPEREAQAYLFDDEMRVLQHALHRYELIERVQFGGQGVVYRARQRSTGRIVAVKVLLGGVLATERQRARFEREIELIARLQHPNIVTVYDSGVVRGRQYYAMEFVEGQTLDNYCVLHDLPPRQIVRLLIKICRGMQHAHQSGIIHRDLKPGNILVDRAGEPRVFDFGLALDLWAGEVAPPSDEAQPSAESHADAAQPPSAGSHADSAQPGMAERPGAPQLPATTELEPPRTLSHGVGVGTLPYLSPEQIGGQDGRVDVRSDVYALGLILYELLADALPYPVTGPLEEVRAAILATPPLPLRQAVRRGGTTWALELHTINLDLEMILAKALAKRKEERYQSVAALAEDLERWLAGEEVSARAGSRAYRLRKAFRRHRVPVTIAAAILAAIVVSGAVATVSWAQVRAQRDNARLAASTTFDLFDMALTEIEDSVRPLAGGVVVRDRLVQRLAARLPRLEGLFEADRFLAPIRMRLLEKHCDIALVQGRRDEALAYGRAFLEAAQALAAGGTPEITGADVVRAFRKMAEASDAPEPWYAQGRAAASAAGISSLAVRGELYRLLLSYGRHLLRAKHYDQALEPYEAALRLCPPDEPGGPWTGRGDRLLGEALDGLGMCLHALGRHDDGRAALDQALALRRQIVAENPADTEARLDLLWSLSRRARLAYDAGTLQEARQVYAEAAAQSELLATLDPTATASDQPRYSVHHVLATVLLKLGELAEADRQAEKAAAIARSWAARDTGETARRTAIFALLLQGQVHQARQAWPAAIQAGEAAAQLAQQCLASEPASATFLQQLVQAHDFLAAVRGQTGDLPAELHHREQALALQERACTLAPDSVEARMNLWSAKLNLAVVHLDLGDAAGRVTAVELLLSAWQELGDLGAAGKLAGWERRQQSVRGKIEGQLDRALTPVGPPGERETDRQRAATQVSGRTSTGSLSPSSGGVSPDSQNE